MPLETQPRPAHCQYCDRDYVYGDIISGVRFDYEEDPATLELTTPGEYFEGHYECVLKAIGPERALEAIQAGRLPRRQVVDEGRVKAVPKAVPSRTKGD